MEALKTITTSGAGTNDFALLDNWDDGLAADGLYLDCEWPVTVGTAGAPTVADLIACLDYYLGVVDVSYGEKKQHKPWVGADGIMLRHAHRVMTLGEVTNDFVGVAQTTGAKTWRARLYLTPSRQKAEGPSRAIGPTQGKTIEIKVTEGGALTAGALNLSRTALTGAVTRVIPRYVVASDQWTHLPHYREINRAAQDVTGPEGLMLAVWDDNAPYLTTQLGKLTLRVGRSELVKQLEPRYLNTDYLREIDAGGSSITDAVTLLYAADPFAHEHELPVGAVYMKLVNQDVQTLKLRCLYYPELDEPTAQQVATEAATRLKAEVVASMATPSAAPHQNGHAAVGAVDLVRAGDPRFGTVAGLHATTTGGTAVYVPPAVSAAAKGLPGVARQVQKAQALRVPGATGVDGRGRRSLTRDAVRGSFASAF